MTDKELEELIKLKQDYDFFDNIYQQFEDNSNNGVIVNQLVIVLMGGNANPNITLVGYDTFQKKLFYLIKKEIKSKLDELKEKFKSYTLTTNNDDKR